jgi:hypothetical protein
MAVVSPTRNHRCRTLDELLHHATEWFASARYHFYHEMRNLYLIAA